MEDKVLTEIEKELDLEELMKRFAHLWVKCLGTFHQTYNFHVFQHLHHNRKQGMLSEICNFYSEGVYGVMKTGYRPGTTSIGMQAINRILLRTFVEHTCHKRITYKTVNEKKSFLHPDNLAFDHDNRLWLIKSKVPEEENRMVCAQISTKPFYVKIDGRQVNLQCIGVHTYQGVIEGNDSYKTLDTFIGKLIPVGDALITCPKQILLEST